MKPARPAITVLIHRDGEVDSRSLRIPLWLFRSGLVVLTLVLGLVLVAAILYVPIIGVAAQVPGLRSEIATLREENAQIRRLVATVDSLEAQYAKVRGMLGADLGSRLPGSGALPVAPPIVISAASGQQGGTASVLSHWPLRNAGYVTRGQLGVGDAVAHSGVDIAVPVGTPVRVAGPGSVAESARDAEYGLYVLIRHSDGYETRYAHLSRVLVAPGQALSAGEVLGLSGNSGRSSAPHLHFEITRKGQSLDPRAVLTQGR